MPTQPRYNYRLFMKLIDRKPSLVIVMSDWNNFEYVIRQGEKFSELKETYQSLKNNPSAVNDGIQGYVLPAYNAQHSTFAM